MGGFEFFAAHPDLAQKFQATMSERTAAFARSVATGFDFSSTRTVADIGGGKGTLLAAILRQHGHLRGVLFDLPSMVGAAEEVFRAAGVADGTTSTRACAVFRLRDLSAALITTAATPEHRQEQAHLVCLEW
jgi:hypothetical protein